MCLELTFSKISHQLFGHHLDMTRDNLPAIDDRRIVALQQVSDQFVSTHLREIILSAIVFKGSDSDLTLAKDRRDDQADYNLLLDANAQTQPLSPYSTEIGFRPSLTIAVSRYVCISLVYSSFCISSTRHSRTLCLF